MKPIYALTLLCTGCLALGLTLGRLLPLSPISPGAVDATASVAGIGFRPGQTDSMLSVLEDQRKGYARIRALNLLNSQLPCTVFNPLPAGFKPETTRKPFALGPISAVKLPADRNKLAYFSIRELHELLITRQVTSVELTRFFLARLHAASPRLHCVITFTDDLALRQAARADSELKVGKLRGTLQGIPYGAKDLLSVAGYPTTWGAAPYRNQSFTTTATVIKRLEAAGAVLLAKLSLGELAMDDMWFGGLTRNPWKPEEGSSGSSAGSAASVAAGLMPFAIGSETYGSIVSPAHVCGTTGLRPTFGRVSRNGAMALSWTMDKLGPIARTVEDCAIVFNAIYGPDGEDPSVIDAPFNYSSPSKPTLTGLRIGYLKTDFERKYIGQAFDQATLAKLQALGATLVPMELPKLPVNDMVIMLNAESAAAFDSLTLNHLDDSLKGQRKYSWPNTFRTARLIPAVEYIQASRARQLLVGEMAKKMKEIDIYMAPSLEGDNLCLTNLTGHPTVVLPNGLTPDGHPVSITFIGQLYGEAKLLQAAKVYQDATSFHLQHPPLFP